MSRSESAPRPAYHHGDLRRELIAAAEAIIAERGVDGFTLREAARRVGVSATAPSHHFGDTRGLLTEVALHGFRDFGAALQAADRKGGRDPIRRLHEQGMAYVRFALRHPARFELMFRVDKHDRSNAEFVQVAGQCYRLLEDAIRAAVGAVADQPLDRDGHGLLVAVWSMVHGFSHLALSGQLALHTRGGDDPDVVLGSLLPLTLQYLPSPNKQHPEAG